MTSRLWAKLTLILANAMIALTAATFAAVAQGAQIDFGGLQNDPTLPVEVTANQLQINQTDGSATFSGNVMILQGTMRLTAQMVVVEYAESVEEQRTKISNMVASGGVLVVNGEEAAESEDAIYSIEEGTILMTGNVVLTQGASIISSQRMTFDLNTGKAWFEGRVKTTLKTSSN